MISRLILSFLTLFVAGFVKINYLAVSTLVLGNVAGSQFDNSDKSYLIANDTFWSINTLNGLVVLVPLLILLAIWWGPLKRLTKTLVANVEDSNTMGLVVAILFGLAVFSYPINSYAYFSTVDKTEAIQILPNESAFWIPDVGANKDSQAKMDSEDYYNSNKVATKRFIIPHQKLSGTGGTAWFSGPDSYVPTGRIILVDRTPQSREWVKDAARGTSKDNESFPCQSNEGVNIGVGISIGVSVKEENAAKFLYNFGVLPTTVIENGRVYLADRTDPNVIFTSVYYGRSLAQVTDDVVRKKVQTLVCDEISSRVFDKALADQEIIIKKVEADTTNYLASYGITLNFIGYGDTWTFDDSVQKAINDRYEAQTLQSSLATLQATMQLKVQEGLADGLRAHGLPMVVTPDILQALEGLVKPLSAFPSTPSK